MSRRRSLPTSSRPSKAASPARPRTPPAVASRRKLVAFDGESWHALNLLARDSMKSFQELAEEAFADLLRKHNRPVTLRQALRESARRQPANDRPAAPRKR